MATTNKECALYGGKIKLRFEEARHRYHVSVNGEPFRQITGSVTGALRVLDKPALKYWYANQSVDYLHEIWKHRTLAEADFAMSRKAASVSSRSAADIGSRVHELIRQYIHATIYGTPIPFSSLGPSERNAFDGFKRWVKERDIRFVFSERMVYGLAEDTAGTIDVGYTEGAGGPLILGDFKTGDIAKYGSRIFLEWKFQTAAYQLFYDYERSNLLDVILGPGAAETPRSDMLPIAGRSILKLDKATGEFRSCPVETDYGSDANAFLCCVAITKSAAYQAENDERRYQIR